MNLHSMKITGFFGRKEPVFIKFKDNKLIFVGENGLGKSTIMKVLCYALTCQFEELNEYIFDEIIIKINEQTISIDRRKLFGTKEEFDDIEFQGFYIEMVEHLQNRFIVDLRSRMPSRLFKSIARAVFYNEIYSLEMENYYRYVSPHILRESISLIRDFKDYYRVRYGFQRSTMRKRTKVVDKTYHLREKIKNEIGDIVFLYLPTYRRIERDSKSIFGDTIKFRDSSVGNYEEYVEFGMSDVDEVFHNKTEELKRSFDTTNEKIRQEYYLDVLDSKYDSIFEQRQRVKNLSTDDIDKVIATISKDENYIKQIKESINILKDDEKSSSMDTRQKILSHFFLKFVDSIKELDSKAKVITDFAKVCNKYLINKEIVYNDKIINNERKFSIDVELKDIKLIDDNKKQIDLSSLSSGEKQVVSLFCKLYLQDQTKKYFVLIDEPELSISVGWQKMFLKDVVVSPTCVGLFAVTHSPFIFDRNGLEEYTFDLDEMKEEYIFVSDEMKKEYIFDLDEMKKED